MASEGAGGNNAATTPNHLGTDVPSGDMGHSGHSTDNHNEKAELEDAPAHHPSEKKGVAEDEEEDEDMDALIDELESQDGGQAAEEEEEEGDGGNAPPVNEELLQTSTRTGLTEHEVSQRRKKFGLNQMKEEKENLILKFLGYFVGPIQFVMEVSLATAPIASLGWGRKLKRSLFGVCRLLELEYSMPTTHIGKANAILLGGRRACCRSHRLGRFRCHLRSATPQRRCRFHPRIPGRLHRRRIEEDARPQGRCAS